MPATASRTNRIPVQQLGTLSDVETALLCIADAGPHETRAVWEAMALLSTPREPVRSRVLRAPVLRAFCTSHHPVEPLEPSGLTLAGILIPDRVNLGFCRIPFPLTFHDCWLADGLDLTHSLLPHLRFKGGWVGGIHANGVSLQGDLALDDVVVEGPVELRNAEIEGDLRVAGATLDHPFGVALSGQGMRVRGSVHFTGDFQVCGCIHVPSADVGGNLDLNEGWLQRTPFPRGDAPESERECAILADQISVRGAVMLKRRFRVMGEVRMLEARVRGPAEFGGEFRNPHGLDALSLDGVSVGGSLTFTNQYRAYGKTRLIGAEIHKDLDCTTGRFEKPLDPGEPKPTNRREHEVLRRIALSAGRIRVRGNVYLDDAAFTGGVRLVGARIRGELRVRRTSFTLPADGYEHVEQRDYGLTVLNARGARIDGGCDISDGQADGMFVFQRCQIGADLSVQDLKLTGTLVNGLVLKGAMVRGKLCWERTPATARTKLVLSHASVGRIVHDTDSWPRKGRLFLRGFRYEAIAIALRPPDQRPRPSTAPAAPVGAGQRLWDAIRHGRPLPAQPAASPRTFTNWVQLQPMETFDPHPYEQLSRVLRRNGDDDAARQVGIAREDDRLHAPGLGIREWLVGRVFGYAIRHGYDSRPLMRGAARILVAGILFFGLGSLGGLMAPTSPEVFLDPRYEATGTLPGDYPALNVVAYSLDTFLPPVIDFHQENNWLPDPHRGGSIVRTPVGALTWGGVLRLYLWIHIGAGWVVTSLLLVNLTALIRNR